MKQILGTIFLLCMGVLTNAQFISHATFYTETNAKFTVYLDGEKKNDEPQTRVRVLNLTEPHFKLKIVFADTSIEPIVRKAFPLQDTKGYPVDVTYMISVSKKGEYKLHFMDQTIYPGYIKPLKPKADPITYATVLNPNKQNCTETTLDDLMYELAIQTVASVNADTTKMMLVKQIIATNCLSVSQIKVFMGLFSDESKKLEIALYSYNSAVDKGNYFQLNSEFKNEKNIEELYKAITK